MNFICKENRSNMYLLSHFIAINFVLNGREWFTSRFYLNLKKIGRVFVLNYIYEGLLSRELLYIM